MNDTCEKDYNLSQNLMYSGAQLFLAKISRAVVVRILNKKNLEVSSFINIEPIC